MKNVLCLAPMAGITDWPMRVLCYRMGADYACSEMVSAIGFMCAKPHNDTYRRLLEVHPEESNTAVQAQWKYFSARQHKRRRSYIKTIGE